MTRSYAIKFVERELNCLAISKQSDIFKKAFEDSLELALQASTSEEVRDLKEEIDYIVEQLIFNKV